jgi:single-stranded-DNA-specific exonuclease
MREAVDLVRGAVEARQSILVHGDYDVDGISGTAILFHYLDGLVPDVRRFVPDRRRDGYGIAERAVEWAISEAVGLFIAVDCGTSDVDLIERLEAAGVPVIVCDHHAFPPDGRYAGVMLNPGRRGESYPFGALCGAGVAYKLVEALHASGIRGKSAPETLLDLVALATVGDVAPLIGENRYYVRAGLAAMNTSPRPGVGAIKSFTRLGRRPITAGHIAFLLAPRINAPGRVSRPKPSLEILCEERRDRVMQLASQLELDNDRRKELTERVHSEAAERIRAMPGRDELGGFVLAGEQWDEGVLGIAAARVAEEFGRPAILMSLQGDVAKGSGRSIPGVNLKQQLDHFDGCFLRYGGHAQAVGLTMPSDRIEEFSRGLSERLREFVTPGTGLPLRIDSAIDLEECTFDLLNFLSRCEPFGYGNREPVWRIREVQILRNTTIVGDGHMKLFFQDTRGNPGEAIAFGWDRPETPDDLHNRVVDLAVTIKRGEYLGNVYPELRLVDIRGGGR